MATDQIRTVAGIIRQAKQRRSAAIKQRQEAEKAPSNRLLRPDDLRGEYEAARQLYTTLGKDGPHLITEKDLRSFKRSAAKLGRSFKGGITPQQVIDLSLDDRRERAQTEITYAIPLQSKGSLFHFVTNSGPKSKVARHNVHVEFLTLGSAVSTAEKAATLAKSVAASPIKFDCDCEDHRYRFRYIASVGGFNVGPPITHIESGFPKITNPSLKGIACKHVLRVMKVLSGSATQRKITAAIESMRKTLAVKTQRATNAEVEKMVEQQRRQIGRQAANIETTKERLGRLPKQQEAMARAMQRERAAMASKPKPALTQAQKAAEATKAIRNANQLLAIGAVTKRQHAAIVRRIQEGL